MEGKVRQPKCKLVQWSCHFTYNTDFYDLDEKKVLSEKQVSGLIDHEEELNCTSGDSLLFVDLSCNHRS